MLLYRAVLVQIYGTRPRISPLTMGEAPIPRKIYYHDKQKHNYNHNYPQPESAIASDGCSHARLLVNNFNFLHIHEQNQILWLAK